jgi:hypothetical protein
MKLNHLTRRLLATLSSLGVLCAVVNADDTTVRHVRQPDQGQNAFTVGNRAPLASSAFTKLPIGSIRPDGWVRRQLELETEGFTGRLAEISPWLEKKDNAWLSSTGAGKNGWEEVPYWLKGFGDLGYVLGDKRIIDESKVWIDGVISSQRPNGYFGPESNLTANNGKPDVWPNMVMINALQTYYEFSNDKRVLGLLSGYFKWMLTIPDKDFLLSYWEPQRIGDNIASIYWLFNRTGDTSLLNVVEKLHRGGANWLGGVPNWHGVNMAQGFREPAEYYVLNKDASLVQDTERDYLKMRKDYGEVPGGLYGADENTRKGFQDPRQAAETCAMVEMMLSDEMLLTITGNPTWAERCEDVTFNSLPASMTPDLKSLHYLTSPNMVLIDKGSKAPELQNGGPMLLFNAYDHRCCQHNTSHGWPYYAEHLWLGAANNGLAVALYAPSQVTMKAGDGSPVTIKEETQYPFNENVTFSFSTQTPNKFPLTLRWPTWCAKPGLKVNGKSVKLDGIAGGYIVVDRTWSNGDKLTLNLPMTVNIQPQFHGSESVQRGPLTYSLKIGEKYVRAGGTDKFPSYEVHPTTAWNYGLVTDGQEFKVSKKAFPADGQPFTPDGSPVVITAKARKIPEWQIDHIGLVGLLQDMPAKTQEPIETVQLVPMGAARLRISAFPVVSDSSDAHLWVAPRMPKKSFPASASHVFEGDTLEGLGAGYKPANSDDESIPRFTWWDRKGSTEWVEYDFAKAKTLSSVSVYWFDDEVKGGGCRVPASWKLLYKNGDTWKEVSHSGPFGTAKDVLNSVDFSKVSSSTFRIEVQLQPGFSGGILAWEVK